MSLPIEEWRPVLGYEGRYEVSDQGRVRSAAGHLMKLGRTTKGYVCLVLSRDGRRRTVTVHALVAEAFIGPRPEGQQVRHRDADKTNNAVTNLLYGTQSDNELDKLLTGTNPQANKTHCPQGHSYSEPGNLYLYLGRHRRCRQCQTANDERKVACPDCARPIRRANLGRHRKLSCRAALASPAPAPRPAGKVCRVVVDGDEDESFLVCLTCNPGAEVCCGHHLAPHDADGCHEMVARVKCQCARRPAPAPQGEEGQS